MKKQAVAIFQSDLSRLQRDIDGMARYRVLLQAGLVEQPKAACQNRAFDGGRDNLHIGVRVVPRRSGLEAAATGVSRG